MASKDKVRARINNAYGVLEHLTLAKGTAAYDMLLEAISAATEGEVRHRRMGRVFNSTSYRQSLATAARYFVVTLYATAERHYPNVSSDEEIALHYAMLRRDVLCCMGLRTLVPMPQGFDGLTDLDYARDIVGSE